MEGEYDAVIALLLALTVNVDKLVLLELDALENRCGNKLKEIVKCSDFEPAGDDGNLLQ